MESSKMNSGRLGNLLGDKWTRWMKQAVERTLPVSLCLG
ncbi:hypothetical protein DOT_6002 [Desulfosporosinus sp. OT]|nr:hypothetical protein DOT_6002 [Desulfosporosinus sp. OT]